MPDKELPDRESSDRESYFSVNTWPFYRRVALAPLCLCLVASVHLYRVVVHDQTQWKGGGFGMFSTVDSRSARFVRVYLITADGEIPVVVPTSLNKRITELRAIPTKDRVEQVADALARLRWRQTDGRWSRVAKRIDRKPSGEPLTSQDIHPPRAFLDRTVIQPVPGRRWPIESVGSREAIRSQDELVPFQAVRVELWRYAYDRESNQIRSHCQFEITRASEADS